MLNDAGYPKAENGIRFKMTIDAELNPDLLQQYLKSQLKKVGIDVEVCGSPDFATWADRTIMVSMTQLQTRFTTMGIRLSVSTEHISRVISSQALPSRTPHSTPTPK